MSMLPKKSDLTIQEQRILEQGAKELKRFANSRRIKNEQRNILNNELTMLFQSQQTTLDYLSKRLDLKRSQILHLVVEENKL